MAAADDGSSAGARVGRIGQRTFRRALVASLGFHAAVLFVALPPAASGRFASAPTPSGSYVWWRSTSVHVDFRPADSPSRDDGAGQSAASPAPTSAARHLASVSVPSAHTGARAGTVEPLPAGGRPGAAGGGGDHCLVIGFRFCSSG